MGFGLGTLSAVKSVRRLVERLLGHPEGVHRRRHTAVEDHLGDDLRDLLTGDSDMQRPGYVPLDHLRTVSQNDQSRDGAETTGFQVDGRPVVDLTVDHRVHQAHDLRRQLGHGRRRHRIVVGTIVPLPEIDGGLVQIFSVLLWLLFGAHCFSNYDC